MRARPIEASASPGHFRARAIQAAAFAIVLAALVGTSCTSNSPTATVTTSPGVGLDVARGGTLHLAAVHDIPLDPQTSTGQLSLELFKCCLLRTLFSTNGLSVAQGGSQLQPDLASAPAVISSDGLTWTIQIKRGLHYGPPFADTEITSPDLVRALESAARARANGSTAYLDAAGSSIYSVIAGFNDFASGRAGSISGLSTPDDHTLVIALTQATGDLGWRLAMPAAAPLPPPPAGATARAAGHFVVSSGPYMIDGSQSLDPSTASRAHLPGLVPSRSITLVRNPSWRGSTDTLRPAYASEIDISLGSRASTLYARLLSGEVDAVLDAPPPPALLTRYSTDPELQARLFIDSPNEMEFLSMDLATAPLDDIHVRRAVNLIADKAAVAKLSGGSVVADPATHVFPDPVLDNDLQTYNPYPSPRDAGDLQAAKAEMAMSKYSGPDGSCDAPACKSVLALIPKSAQADAPVWRQDFVELGITLDIKIVDPSSLARRCASPMAQIPVCVSLRWRPLYPDPSMFAAPLFSSAGLFPSCCNHPLLGATPPQLQRWGYLGSYVPSVDDKLNRCQAISAGPDRDRCWSDVDMYLMEQVVPWVPLLAPEVDTIVSAHITNFSFDLFSGVIAVDRMATDRTG